MKQLLPFILLISLYSCRTNYGPVVDGVFVDSLMRNYSPSSAEKINSADIEFWKTRLDSLPGSYSNAQKYAATLSGRFQLYGNIDDIRKADSIMHWLNSSFKGADAGVLRSLANYSILQHRFIQARDIIDSALKIGSERYASEMINFDIALESGNYRFAKQILDQCRSTNDYGYFFRLSKYKHYDGELDSSIAAMKKAAELAGSNISLQQAALSNTGDLYLHAAKLDEAKDQFMQSLRIGSSDYHSLMGLAWIAMLHDKKDVLAENIYRFVKQRTKSLEPYLKMSMLYQYRSDTINEKKYAAEFAYLADDSVYGDMYNKYLIEIYTGVLNEPAKAVAIAERELNNRNTPQTNAWYAWTLFKNNQQQQAIEIYEKRVSGKPLEGLELYYMGAMMKAIGKKNNAGQFFKAAYKNRYDLSPAKQKELEAELK